MVEVGGSHLGLRRQRDSQLFCYDFSAELVVQRTVGAKPGFKGTRFEVGISPSLGDRVRGLELDGRASTKTKYCRRSREFEEVQGKNLNNWLRT